MRNKTINEIGRTCLICGEFKEWDNFHRNKKGLNQKSPYCKLCIKEKSTKYYKENKEKVVNNCKKWISNNRERYKERQRRNNIKKKMKAEFEEVKEFVKSAHEIYRTY